MENISVFLFLLTAISIVGASTSDTNTTATTPSLQIPMVEIAPTRPPVNFSKCYAPKSQVHDLIVEMNFAIQILTGEELHERERLSVQRNQSTQSHHQHRIELCEPWRVAELESDLRCVMRGAWRNQGGELREPAQLRSSAECLIRRLRKVHVFYGMYPQVLFDTYEERVDELERALMELSTPGPPVSGSPTQVPSSPSPTTWTSTVADTATTEVFLLSTAPSMNDTKADALEANSTEPLENNVTSLRPSEFIPTFPAIITTSIISFFNETTEATTTQKPSSTPLTAPSELAGLLWSYLNATTSAAPPADLVEALSNATVREASEAFQFSIKAVYPKCDGYDVFSSTRLDTLINRIDRLMFEVPSSIWILPYVSLLDTVKTSPSPICTQDYVRVAHKVYLRSLIDSDERDQWMALRFRFNTGVFNLFSGRYCSLVTKTGLEVRPTSRRTSYDGNRHEIELETYSHTTRRNQWRIHPVEQGRSFVLKSAYFDHRFFETAATYDWKSPGIYLHILPEENSLQEFSRVFRFSIANSKWGSGVTRTGKSDVPFMSTRQLNALTVFELICVSSDKEHLPVPEYEPPLL